MRILGVDPGVKGGLAIIELADMPVVVDAIDIPTIGSGAKERVDVIDISTWVALLRPAFAFIERAQADAQAGRFFGF